MKTSLDLKELGARFGVLDKHVVAVVKNRMDLAERVAAHKIRTRQPIVRLDIEDARMREMQKDAVALGMNPFFIASLAYAIIGESCKLQTVLYQQAEAAQSDFSEPQDEEKLRQFYRKNLLALTDSIAETYDEQYDGAYYATHDYTRYEYEIVEREVSSLPDTDAVLDLGCATGRMTIALAPKFKKAIGYDLCPHMLQVARRKASEQGITNVTYEEVDLEGTLPLPDASVSFVVMNMGTASDVCNLSGLLKEVRRVLRRGGKFVLSFYNKEALVYAWDFLPWPVGLAAGINVALNCLEVHRQGTIFSVYAHPYTAEEAVELFPKGMSATEVSTYPTISAILPHDLLHDKPEARENVAALDRALASSNKGAYIVITGVRN